MDILNKFQVHELTLLWNKFVLDFQPVSLHISECRLILRENRDICLPLKRAKMLCFLLLVSFCRGTLGNANRSFSVTVIVALCWTFWEIWFTDARDTWSRKNKLVFRCLDSGHPERVYKTLNYIAEKPHVVECSTTFWCALYKFSWVFT